MLAEPIIWRRYHSPRLSPSMEALANVARGRLGSDRHDDRVRPQVAEGAGLLRIAAALDFPNQPIHPLRCAGDM
jgi:hypothetical protein